MHEHNDPTNDKKPIMQKITTSHDGLYGPSRYSDMLTPTDPILQLRGAGNYKIYKELASDPQVKATFEQRRSAVVSRPWEVVPGGKKLIDRKAAEHLEEVLGNVQFDRITDKMLWGNFFGFAVSEVMWKIRNNKVEIDNIIVREQYNFEFDIEHNIYQKQFGTAKSKQLPDKKIWHYNAGMYHDDDPYGLGLAHYLYWLVFFKKNGMRFWAKFLEKFSQPTTVGTYGPEASTTDQDQLLHACRSVGIDTAAIIPQGTQIALLEAARSGSADYSVLHDRMDAAIAKVVLLQTMTTDNGSSRSQAEVHSDVRNEVVKSDADLVNDSFSCCVAKWLTEWNFPGAEIPTVKRVLDDPEDLDNLASRDEKLFKIGFKPTLKRVKEVYGDEYVEVETADDETPTDPNQQTNTSNLAEFGEAPNQVELELALANLDNTRMQKHAEKLLEPLFKYAEKNPDKLEGKLAELYDQMDSSLFNEALVQIMFLSEIFGRATGEQP